MTNTEAWDYAIGMIKVDGLEPTKEFKEYIEKEKCGEITMEAFCCQFILLMEVILGKKEYFYKIVYDADEGISEMGERNGDD